MLEAFPLHHADGGARALARGASDGNVLLFAEGQVGQHGWAGELFYHARVGQKVGFFDVAFVPFFLVAHVQHLQAVGRQFVMQIMDIHLRHTFGMIARFHPGINAAFQESGDAAVQGNEGHLVDCFLGLFIFVHQQNQRRIVGGHPADTLLKFTAGKLHVKRTRDVACAKCCGGTAVYNHRTLVHHGFDLNGR